MVLSARLTVTLRTWVSLTRADSTSRTSPTAPSDRATPNTIETATVIRTRTDETSRSMGSVTGQVDGAEAVSLASHRLEIGQPERAVDLAPEISDVHLDDVR